MLARMRRILVEARGEGLPVFVFIQDCYMCHFYIVAFVSSSFHCVINTIGNGLILILVHNSLCHVSKSEEGKISQVLCYCSTIR